MRRNPTLLAAAALTLAACATDTPERRSSVVRDSAGIRIVENSTPLWQPGEEWRLSPEPTVDIGGGQTDDDQLYRVAGALRLGDDRVVVANGGTNELRFYNPQGEHIATVGGQGGGPGEFQGLSWIGGYRGDSLIAFDQLQRRISVFDGWGRLGRTVTIRSRAEFAFPDIAGVFADGSFLLFSNASSFYGTKGPFRFQNALVRYSPEGVLTDSLGIHPGAETVGVTSGTSTIYFYVPFNRTTDYAVSGDGFYVASNDTYAVERYDLTGNLTSLVRKHYEPVQVTEAMVEGVLARVLGDSPSPEMQALADAAVEMAPQETAPAFGNATSMIRGSQVLVDGLADLWVLELDPFGESPPSWSVFDPQGVLLGTVRFPRGFRPLDIGDDYVLGLWRDSLDVEHVRLYDLIK